MVLTLLKLFSFYFQYFPSSKKNQIFQAFGKKQSSVLALGSRGLRGSGGVTGPSSMTDMRNAASASRKT